MSRGLAEQIAVLDGFGGNVLNAYNQINASNGANYSGGSSYPENNGIPLMTSSIGLAGMAAADQDVLFAYNQINASNGANYSGGSSYPEQNAIPLMTSSIGLAGMGSMRGFADADLLAYANGVGQIPNTLPARMNVLDASGGANYSGGSSYAPGLPLLPSSAGLAGGPPLRQMNPTQKFGALQARANRVLQAMTAAIRAGRKADTSRFKKMLEKLQRQLSTMQKTYPYLRVETVAAGVSPWR